MSRNFPLFFLAFIACQNTSNPADTEGNLDTDPCTGTDCDGTEDSDNEDLDGDGFKDAAFGGDDCDDSDAAVNPGGRSSCLSS